MAGLRQLVVVADDFGIGPETDRGILELGAAGRVTSTVLLVNSPFAEPAIAAWNRAGRPIELGWHPNPLPSKPYHNWDWRNLCRREMSCYDAASYGIKRYNNKRLSG